MDVQQVSVIANAIKRLERLRFKIESHLQDLDEGREVRREEAARGISEILWV